MVHIWRELNLNSLFYFYLISNIQIHPQCVRFNHTEVFRGRCGSFSTTTPPANTIFWTLANFLPVLFLYTLMFTWLYRTLFIHVYAIILINIKQCHMNLLFLALQNHLWDLSTWVGLCLSHSQQFKVPPHCWWTLTLCPSFLHYKQSSNIFPCTWIFGHRSKNVFEIDPLK